MQIAADLFGTVLLEYLDGSRLPSHLRRGDGRISVLDVGRYFSPFASFPQLDQALLREARGDVLDLGAGAGRVSLYLEEQVLRESPVSTVVAADESPGACLCMRRRGVSRVVQGGWEELAKDPDVRGRFDTIALLGAGLGMAGSPGGLERLLEAARAMLRPAGLVLATAVPGPGDPAGRGGLSALRLRVESMGRIGEWFHWLLVSPQALRVAAANCGLAVVREPLVRVGDRDGAGAEFGAVLSRGGGA